MKKLPLALLCIAFLLLCVAHKAVGGEETKLPADAVKLLEKFQADEAKILADAEDKVAKSRRALVEALTKQQEKSTKGGKLDEALALKAKIEEQTKLMPGGSLLAPVVTAPAFDIKKATWSGGGGTGASRDVTEAVVGALTSKGTLTLENRFFGFDPAPNAGKELVIVFAKGNGRVVTKTFPENAVITSAMFAP
jgi:hypothetical protein